MLCSVLCKCGRISHSKDVALLPWTEHAPGVRGTTGLKEKSICGDLQRAPNHGLNFSAVVIHQRDARLLQNTVGQHWRTSVRLPFHLCFLRRPGERLCLFTLVFKFEGDASSNIPIKQETPRGPWFPPGTPGSVRKRPFVGEMLVKLYCEHGNTQPVSCQRLNRPFSV